MGPKEKLHNPEISCMKVKLATLPSTTLAMDVNLEVWEHPIWT